MASDPPKVLISYSHDSLEHRDCVLVFQAPPQGRSWRLLKAGHTHRVVAVLQENLPAPEVELSQAAVLRAIDCNQFCVCRVRTIQRQPDKVDRALPGYQSLICFANKKPVESAGSLVMPMGF